MNTPRWLETLVSRESYLWGAEVGEAYHGAASRDMDHQWQWMIWPVLKHCPIDYATTVDFAAGYGRNTRKLLPLAEHVTAVDVNPDCVEALRSAFPDGNVTVLQNDGAGLAEMNSDSYSFVYSFDAMVHFDVALIASYLPEFARVLRTGGHAFIHHSNYTGNPGGDFRSNPHWRNYMTNELFRHLAIRAGFTVLDQRPISWGGVKNIDSFTVLRKD